MTFAADANILINICRLAAQRYFFAYQEPIPVEQLVRSVCDTKQVSPLASVHESKYVGAPACCTCTMISNAACLNNTSRLHIYMTGNATPAVIAACSAW